MSKEHHIIYVPGLNDQSLLSQNLTKLIPLVWKRQGFHIHVVSLHWEEGYAFDPKLKLITNKIDELTSEGKIVSLIGQSAGGSAVLNAFSERRNVVNGVVNIVGRLRQGVNLKPTLDQAAKHSKAFKESVLLLEEKNEPTLTANDRTRVMTIRPLWDEAVPVSTMSLNGATNLVGLMVEHVISGSFFVSFYSPIIFKFLSSKLI